MLYCECGGKLSVVDSDTHNTTSEIRRRRRCTSCKRKIWTVETEEGVLPNAMVRVLVELRLRVDAALKGNSLKKRKRRRKYPPRIIPACGMPSHVQDCNCDGAGGNR